VLLEPTSPLRESVDIELSLDMLASSGASSVVGVCRAEGTHPAFVYRQDNHGRLQPFMGRHPTGLRRQDIEPMYFLEGTVYVSKISALMEHRSFYHDDTVGYEVPKWKSLEIDDLADFFMVEALMKHKEQLV
jgi:CMP-N,N'-diacetyllegionaminic acid synthase